MTVSYGDPKKRCPIRLILVADSTAVFRCRPAAEPVVQKYRHQR